ncbi:MAG: hypothetical protein M3083_06300 [Actinomycetota bacterium]|nr:hypothetical protein [Actinomycetota bacterium]
MELLGRKRDVFAAACKDFHRSPYGAAGQPCPVPVWTCLCCPMAVFTPSKVPNLLRLQDHLDRQWRSLRAEEWMVMYGAANVPLGATSSPSSPGRKDPRLGARPTGARVSESTAPRG